MTLMQDEEGGADSSPESACRQGLDPDEYVEDMKKKGIRVPGIGHRIKSKDNRDKRVELLIAYARRFFPATKYLNYAQARWSDCEGPELRCHCLGTETT